MDLSSARAANHSVEANRRLPAPPEPGHQSESPFSARAFVQAAVAHLRRSVRETPACA